jgi:hypothetical protein
LVDRRRSDSVPAALSLLATPYGGTTSNDRMMQRMRDR